jgi:hypothetical protein
MLLLTFASFNASLTNKHLNTNSRIVSVAFHEIDDMTLFHLWAEVFALIDKIGKLVQGDSKHVKNSMPFKTPTFPLLPRICYCDHNSTASTIAKARPMLGWTTPKGATRHMTHPQNCVYKFSWLKFQLTYKSPSGNPRTTTWLEKQGVCHNVALPFTLKKYLKAKEELWKVNYFTMQNIIFK